MKDQFNQKIIVKETIYLQLKIIRTVSLKHKTQMAPPLCEVVLSPRLLLLSGMISILIGYRHSSLDTCNYFSTKPLVYFVSVWGFRRVIFSLLSLFLGCSKSSSDSLNCYGFLFLLTVLSSILPIFTDATTKVKIKRSNLPSLTRLLLTIIEYISGFISSKISFYNALVAWRFSFAIMIFSLN